MICPRCRQNTLFLYRSSRSILRPWRVTYEYRCSNCNFTTKKLAAERIKIKYLFFAVVSFLLSVVVQYFVKVDGLGGILFIFIFYLLVMFGKGLEHKYVFLLSTLPLIIFFIAKCFLETGFSLIISYVVSVLVWKLIY